MAVLEIIAALILLLITTIIILSRSKKTSISEPKMPEPAKHDSKSSPVVNAEPAVKLDLQEVPVISVPELDSGDSAGQETTNLQTDQAVPLPENNGSLPQDSILRRHYLAHINSLIESLYPRPTDAVLCRHYDTMRIAKLEECLTNQHAMAQLIEECENNKPIVNAESSVLVPVQQREEASELEKNCSRLPEDSVLRRHYLAHLYSMIESLSPLRPTESVLCRHYETMLVAKLELCLNNSKAMMQLLSDYESQK